MSEKPPDREVLRTQYDDECREYKKLKDSLKRDLKMLLDEAGIRVLAIESRIKEFDSFWTKMRLEHYDNPLEDMNDICGLRVICYYPSDLEPVCKVIKDAFEIIEYEDKADSMEPEEFGYLSRHIIATPKGAWLTTPSYQGLDGLKAEIQVRTIFQHAWAELSRELAYKKKEHVPRLFQRGLSRLSAMLENVDEQFDAFHLAKAEYGRSMSEEARESGHFDVSQELNIDTLQAFLSFLVPNRAESVLDTSVLLEDLQTLQMTFVDILDACNRSPSALQGLEQDVRDVWGTGFEGWSQAGIARAALDLMSDLWWNHRHEVLSVYPAYAQVVDRWRRKVEQTD